MGWMGQCSAAKHPHLVISGITSKLALICFKFVMRRSSFVLRTCRDPVPPGERAFELDAAVDLQRGVRRRPHEEVRRGRELLLDMPQLQQIRGGWVVT